MRFSNSQPLAEAGSNVHRVLQKGFSAKYLKIIKETPVM